MGCVYSSNCEFPGSLGYVDHGGLNRNCTFTRFINMCVRNASMVKSGGKGKLYDLVCHPFKTGALCKHHLSLLLIEWLSKVFGLALEGRKQPTVAEKLIKLGHLEEVKVITRFL